MQYKHLSNLYDTFIEVDYLAWSTFVGQQIDQHAPKGPTKVLELGCGTGSLTQHLASKYPVLALDISDDMLAIAKQKVSSDNVTFLTQDMSQLRLTDKQQQGLTVAVSTCDSLNYLTEPEELMATFERVHDVLATGGIFVFDMNTPYKYETILADNSFNYTDDTSAVIWENLFDDESQLNEYYLTLFKQNPDGTYNREQESHYQLAYNLDFIKQSLSFAGFELVATYDDYTDKSPTDTTQRIVFIAKK